MAGHTAQSVYADVLVRMGPISDAMHTMPPHVRDPAPLRDLILHLATIPTLVNGIPGGTSEALHALADDVDALLPMVTAAYDLLSGTAIRGASAPDRPSIQCILQFLDQLGALPVSLDDVYNRLIDAAEGSAAHEYVGIANTYYDRCAALFSEVLRVRNDDTG